MAEVASSLEPSGSTGGGSVLFGSIRIKQGKREREVLQIICRFALEEGLEVAEDAGGDGDGTFYLPGGETVEPALLKETLDFLESVRYILNLLDTSLKHQVHEELDEIGAEWEEEELPASVGDYFEQQFVKFLRKEDDEGKKGVKEALFR